MQLSRALAGLSLIFTAAWVSRAAAEPAPPAAAPPVEGALADPGGSSPAAAAPSSAAPTTLSSPLYLPPRRQPRDVELLPEKLLPTLTTGLLFTLSPGVLDYERSLPKGSAVQVAPRDRRGLNRLDRTVVGNHSGTANRLSDGVMYSSIALPHLLGLGELLFDTGRAGAIVRESAVILETLAVTGMSTQILKFALHRPRPYAYDPTVSAIERADREARLSFPSGHTSLAFSMATSYSYLYQSAHPESSLRIPIWIGTHALAAATGLARVSAGKHFWTDVLAGAALGSGMGLFIPWLHQRSGERGSPLARLGDLRVTPLMVEGGFGASIFLGF